MIRRPVELGLKGKQVNSGRKSTDAGLTNAERKRLRESEAQEEISNHDDAKKALHENPRVLANSVRGRGWPDSLSCLGPSG
jgi:hypothetical protein